MKISGFSFVRNATKLYLPVWESISSVLPMVDEFVLALGKGDVDDRTLEEIERLNSDKVRIINTQWDIECFRKNTIYAQQTDVAKRECAGDWLLYIQSDEVIHENHHQKIVTACEKELNNKKVEAFVFDFRHFWGDYDHHHKSHAWYPQEIRIIRNRDDIHSWKDAQSFRSFETFEETFEDYSRKEGARKLNSKRIHADIFHYGYVRPPEMMTMKSKSSSTSYHGKEKSAERLKDLPIAWDYGPLNRIPVFKDTHPKVMEEWISKLDWVDKLQYSGNVNENRPSHKHERLKYRMLSFFEQSLLNGRSIGGFQNFKMI